LTTPNRALKSLLDNGEIVTNMSIEQTMGEDGEERVKVDKRDEMKVVAYIQALSQVILNISTTQGQSNDVVCKLIAATLSALSEFFFNSTTKIQKASTQAARIVITHGLSKIVLKPEDLRHGSGFFKVYMNVNYLMSSRFTDQTTLGAMEASLNIIKTFVEKVNIPYELQAELLNKVSSTLVRREQYLTW